MAMRVFPFVLALSLACCARGEIARDLRDIVGVTHVAGKYHLTDQDFLNEGADEILALGSRVIKVWFFAGQKGRVPESYPYHSQWPKVASLVEGAQTPYFVDLFRKPFTTYILVTASLGRDEAYWRKGITDEHKKDEQRQFYELARHFLTQYEGTGKTFILQHWEGDWLVRGSFKGDQEPTPQALANMVEWLNARQAGVNQAREEVGRQTRVVVPQSRNSSGGTAASGGVDAAGRSTQPKRAAQPQPLDATSEPSGQGVRVYHATEVNRVVQSMRDGFPGVTNKVLPHTKLDLVSYSAWDAATSHYADPNVLREALDFIAAHAPDSPDFGNRNVYLGEFGMPENVHSLEKVQIAIPNAVRTALDWGCPYIVYWQLYCNELKDPSTKVPITSNDAVRGFWLIRPDGTKAWTWDYFHGLCEAVPRHSPGLSSWPK
jgi:hypothetical protein